MRLALPAALLIAFAQAPALEYSRQSSVEYGRVHGVTLAMEILTPAKPKGAGVIWIVSSNGVSNREQTLAPSFERRVSPLLHRGYTVFAVVHRSSPGFHVPDYIDDARRAVRFVRHQAAKFGVDGRRLGIAGSSSGGLIALTVAMSAQDGNAAATDPVDRESSRVQAAGIFFPPTDLLNAGETSQNIVDLMQQQAGKVDPAFQFQDADRKTGARTPITDRAHVLALLRDVSPVTHVTPGDPPTLLIHGDADKAVPLRQSRLLMERLNAAKVEARLVVREGKGHAWPGWEADSELIAEWFDAHLQPIAFARDIAPVVAAACSTCHRPDGPAPFNLVTYEDLRQHAKQIAAVTKKRFMPPWKTDPQNGPFVGQRQLTNREVALFDEWVAAGAPAGDVDHGGERATKTKVWQLGTPDLVVTIPSTFELRAEGPDVFRVFAIRVPIDRVRYVRGIEFLPGNARVVHHANIRIDATRATRRLDDADPTPGYDGAMPRSAVYPDGHFLGWTPGQIAPLVPPAFAWTLGPGTDLVVQLHMQPGGAAELVQPSIGLYFSEEPPTTTPVTLRLGDQGIDIPPGAPRYTIRDSYVLPFDVQLHAVQPHSHYRARAIAGTATFPDGRTETLIHIADWDFRWQHVYRFETPRVLPKGTRLAMEYTFDNSQDNPRNPDRPPRRVLWGQRTADEMGDLWFQFVPRDPRQREALNADTQRKMTLEDVRGYETMLRVTPSDAELHNDLALLYLGLGRTDVAVDHFRMSVQLKPTSAAMRFNLATALSVGGQLDEAIAEYEQVLTIDPAYTSAHNNLGSVLSARGDPLGALRHFTEALRLDPENAQAQRNLVRELAAILMRRLLHP